MPKKNDKEVKKMRKIIIAVGLVLVSAVAMSADIPERRILNAVYDSAKEVLRIDLYDTATSTTGSFYILGSLPAGTNKIGSLSDTTFQAVDLDIRDLGDGDTVGARQHGSWTVNNPSDVKVYAFTFYDTTASGTVTFTGVLKSVGFTSGGAVTDSATIYINGVQYDCLLGGEDSGEGLEGYLLNPEIRWELNGVTRLRIKLSGYTP